MSSATICLFSVALCNVGSLNQFLFEQPQQQVAQQQPQGGNFFGQQATNLFNGFVNTATLGTFNNNQNNKQKPRPPHSSPCPKKFQYATNGKQWKGVIRLSNVDLSRDLILEADFALPVGRNNQGHQHNHQHNHGRIELVNDPETLADDVENGLPLLFETIFSSQNPVPKLIAIHKNRREICAGQTGDVSAHTFRLTFRLNADDGSSDRFTVEDPHFQIKPSPPVNAPVQNPPINNNKPITNSQNFENINQFQDDNAVCGVPVVLSQSLVVGGQPAGHGEWPWLVAFYRSTDGNLQFICGGSLISAKHVLTAAHCIQDKGRETPQQPKDALLFIGKHNLIEWNEEGYEKRGAVAFKVHPDWKPAEQNYDADIAIIQMDKPVKYSKFIRPICLWNGPAEVSKVVGQVGIVCGWGKNEDGKLNTAFPKKVNVPIVSDGTCLRAHEAFVHITSDRTFCAGGKNGEGPCQGDSGGALVLKVNKKWFIRGIVSASLRDGTGCDVNSYAIFTDIAQFTLWIKSQM